MPSPRKTMPKAAAYSPAAPAQDNSRHEFLQQVALAMIVNRDGLCVDCNDAAVRLFGYADRAALLQDMSARVSAAQTITEQLQRAHVIAAIASRFVGMAACDDALMATLADIGRYTGVERVNLFRFNAAHTPISNTHRWTVHAVENLHAQLQLIPVAPFHWADQQLLDHGLGCVNDVQALPAAAAAAAEKTIWL